VQALTELDIAIRLIRGRPVKGAPGPTPGLLEYARAKYGREAAP
jgi:hypothetical protein